MVVSRKKFLCVLAEAHYVKVGGVSGVGGPVLSGVWVHIDDGGGEAESLMIVRFFSGCLCSQRTL